MEYSGSPFELKALDDDGAIEGLLAGFGDCDLQGDKLLAGCLSKSLAERRSPLPMLFCHDLRRPIGAWKHWREQSDGLFVSGKLTLATRDAQEAYALVKDGGLSGLSIGWEAKESTVERDGTRTVSQAVLYEGSLVPVGAHPRAKVTSVKSWPDIRELADWMQRKGVSGRLARELAGPLWAALIEQSEQSAIDANLKAIAKAKRDADEAKALAEVERLFDEHSARMGLGG